ncbi:MAG: hypothetical protein IJE24_04710 [Oscillospiraceae bacterium]|nr:hypothetical protein [Oscillospiraceae bacterium]
MVKKCNICGHLGELTWRNGKYYCAMCGSEIAETDPVVHVQPAVQTPRSAVATNVTCPICRNKENNWFDGIHYHCALCGTSFDLQQAAQTQQFQQYNAAPAYTVQELRNQKDRNTTWGIVFIFLFWPASIYFFYKAHKANKQLKAMGY